MRHTKPLLFLAPIVLTVASIACGGDSKGGLLVATVVPQQSQQQGSASPQSGGGATGGSTNNSQPTQAPTASGGNSNSGGGATASNSDIAQLMTNFAKVNSFRAAIMVTGGSTGAVNGTMEIVQPDKMHMAITSAGQNIEIITIGNDTYTKIGPQWTKTTSAGAGRIFDPKQIQDSIKSASADERAVTKGGTDNVDGKQCQVYTSNSGGSPTDICIANGLPLKVTTKGGGGTTTIIFKDYNTNIDIKPPI